MRLAAAFSKQSGHIAIEPQDLLDALAHLGGISDVVLAELGYRKKKRPTPNRDADQLFIASTPLAAIVAEAHEQARQLGHGYVGTEHLLLALAHKHPELILDGEAIRRQVRALLGHLEKNDS